jgi:hypothetical protein
MPKDKSNCQYTDFWTILLGGHRDEMVPLPRYFAASAIPITDFLLKEKLTGLWKGQERQMGKSSAF